MVGGCRAETQAVSIDHQLNSKGSTQVHIVTPESKLTNTMADIVYHDSAHATIPNKPDSHTVILLLFSVTLTRESYPVVLRR